MALDDRSPPVNRPVCPPTGFYRNLIRVNGRGYRVPVRPRERTCSFDRNTDAEKRRVIVARPFPTGSRYPATLSATPLCRRPPARRAAGSAGDGTASSLSSPRRRVRESFSRLVSPFARSHRGRVIHENIRDPLNPHLLSVFSISFRSVFVFVFRKVPHATSEPF